MNNLKKMLIKCQELKATKYNFDFYIPALWQNNDYSAKDIIEVNPYAFIESKIKEIFRSNLPIEKSKPEYVYNAFIRLFAAFDHSRNGSLWSGSDEFRNTGTFPKAIALLPYIKKLGIDTIYLLPITSIGKYGNKGNLGSPYSIFNHYKLDTNLAEPLLDMTVEEQFSAFVEAAKLLNINVVLEFVFRTASLDSELAFSHPEWFYWVEDTGENFLPPAFTDSRLAEIKMKIKNNDMTDLPAPEQNYISRFQDTPKQLFQEDGKICGFTEDGIKVTIPNAFADWPPDDKQPLWSDVTYLKIFDHQNFNYIAYNTIRMYDNSLETEENENSQLWEYISNIIPHYIDNYDIDGVMIDMGHALPSKLRNEIVERGRKLKSNFIFWEENFAVDQKSKDEGYDAVLGYMPFDFHYANKMRNIIKDFENETFPIEFFLTNETHNTKRSVSYYGMPEYNKLVWSMCLFLRGLKFIHNGFELSEPMPVNTGLGFTIDEIAKYSVDMLPLFSTAELSWTAEDKIIDFIHSSRELADKIKNEIGHSEGSKIKLLESYNDDLIVFDIDDKLAICAYFATEPIRYYLPDNIRYNNKIYKSNGSYDNYQSNLEFIELQSFDVFYILH